MALACATLAIPGLLVVLPPIPEKSPIAVLVIALICVWGMTVPTGWVLLLLAWLNKRAGRPSGQGVPPSAGGQAPGTRYQPGRAGSFRQSITVTGTPPKPRRSSVPPAVQLELDLRQFGSGR